MLPQDNRATPPDGAQGIATPETKLVQRTLGWNAKRKAKIGASGADKERARNEFRVAELDLAEAADEFVRKAQP